MVNSAIGGSTNCPPHMNAIARHVGVPLDIEDWETVGHRRAAAGECAARGASVWARASIARAACRRVFSELMRAGRCTRAR